MQAQLFHLHALSALHCGTGQSVGVVDLPIARARATQLPIVPGSSLRGVLRQAVTRSDKAAALSLFGPESISGNDEAFAGALAVGDAHLLLLPVRSLAGVVCFATSPFILRRYQQDVQRAGVQAVPALPPALGANTAQVAQGSVNVLKTMLVLEDVDLPAQTVGGATAWAEFIAQRIYPDDKTAHADLCSRFAILPDDIFNFLAETATEIRTRIAIDAETGTVKRGALWYEENLPAESVLWGIYALAESRNGRDARQSLELAQKLPSTGSLLQLGGKAGVGRGLVRYLPQGV